MSRSRLSLRLVAGVLAAFGTLPLHAGDEVPFRGVTVSCQTWGAEWETPEMAAALDELKALGANAIALHPYALVNEDGSLRIPPNPEPSHLTTPIRWAHERGLRVMLIPHLGYWHTKFTWRGEIDFSSTEEWDRFFADYTRWITRMACLAEQYHLELFCVGLEYVNAEKFDRRWRDVIASVRSVYRGKLTYGANWDRYGEVPFWDAVDLIGVLAYFPLTSKRNPSAKDIQKGWPQWMEPLKALSDKYGKPVVFTEIGYNESANAASKPWAFRKGGENARAIQARCLDEGLALQQRYPSFLAGMFLWKWFPDLPLPDTYTFDLRTATLKQIIARRWGGKPPNDGSPGKDGH
jgi:hypothetical protein